MNYSNSRDEFKNTSVSMRPFALHNVIDLTNNYHPVGDLTLDLWERGREEWDLGGTITYYWRSVFRLFHPRAAALRTASYFSTLTRSKYDSQHSKPLGKGRPRQHGWVVLRIKNPSHTDETRRQVSTSTTSQRSAGLSRREIGTCIQGEQNGNRAKNGRDFRYF